MELTAEIAKMLAAVGRGLEPAPPAPEPWMTSEAAAEYACVSTETIRDWVRRGWLRAGRAGRELRLRKSEVDACLLNQQQSPTDLDAPSELDDRAAELVRELEGERG